MSDALQAYAADPSDEGYWSAMKRRIRLYSAALAAWASIAASPASASETAADGQTVPWWTPPGETDVTAFAALILLFLLIFAVFHLYARFDRFAENHNEGTPLKTTVPMLLMIAFAYEIFPPLSHFSVLLPLALIATALARDLMLWFEPMKEHTLKGELDGVLLEELQHQQLGEHDRDGRRVQMEPRAEPPPASEPQTPAEAKSEASAEQAAPATSRMPRAPARKKRPAKKSAPVKGGNDSD